MKKLLSFFILICLGILSFGQKYNPSYSDKNGTWKGSDDCTYFTYSTNQTDFKYWKSGGQSYLAKKTVRFKDLNAKYNVFWTEYTDGTYTILVFQDKNHIIVCNSWDADSRKFLVLTRAARPYNIDNTMPQYQPFTPSKSVCYICHGTGIQTCTYCSGRGYNIRYYTPPTYGYGTAQTVEIHDACPFCSGTGSKVCTGCNGTGYF